MRNFVIDDKCVYLQNLSLFYNQSNQNKITKITEFNKVYMKIN
jgi:hypothetical protein